MDDDEEDGDGHRIHPSTSSAPWRNANGQSSVNDVELAPWRQSAGRYWFDRSGVPRDAKTYDYGFKLKPV